MDYKHQNVGSSQGSSVLQYFCSLFIHPSFAINKILKEKPGFKRLAIFIFIVSTLRGIIEGLWMLMREGQFLPVVISPVLFKSYMNLGIPFILSSITCGYVRWVGFALLPCLLAKFWGKEARYKDFLRVTGIMMGLYLVTILPNFAYLFFKLPMIQFNVSKVYNPAIGLGQWITALGLVTIIYKASRIILGLSGFQALLCGISVLLVNIGALVFGSFVFFNLDYFNAVSFRGTLNIATYIFIVITILTIPVFLWVGMSLKKGFLCTKNTG
jgi:hypothetical protein